jgi:hypothetical protein
MDEFANEMFMTMVPLSGSFACRVILSLAHLANRQMRLLSSTTTGENNGRASEAL